MLGRQPSKLAVGSKGRVYILNASQIYTKVLSEDSGLPTIKFVGCATEQTLNYQKSVRKSMESLLTAFKADVTTEITMYQNFKNMTRMCADARDDAEEYIKKLQRLVSLKDQGYSESASME